MCERNIYLYAQILNEICAKKHENTGKKIVQKLFYLIEKKNVNLYLNYRIHYYGPYSVNLDNILHMLEINQIIDIDTTGKTHIISMNQETFNELTPEEKENVRFVIDNFANKSSYDLEAITTLHFIASLEKNKNLKDEEIIKEVIKIKADKFPKEKLEKDLDELQTIGYIKDRCFV